MNKKAFLAIAIMVALIVPASFVFTDKVDDNGYVDQNNVRNLSPEIFLGGLGGNSTEDGDESGSLKDMAEFLFGLAQMMLEPMNLDNLDENDYDIWTGTKTVSETIVISKHLVLADGLILTFEEDGKILIPIGYDLIINGTVEFKNEGNGIYIEFFDDGDDDYSKYSSIYIGQIPTFRVSESYASSLKLICENSFNVGLEAYNNFDEYEDGNGTYFVLDYGLYLDILGDSEDVSLKIITKRSYSESTYDNDFIELANNPDGAELNLKVEADLSAIYNMALAFESTTLKDALIEFTNLVDEGIFFVPDIDIILEIYDLSVKNDWDDSYTTGMTHTSVRNVELSLISDTLSKSIELSLNIGNYENIKEETHSDSHPGEENTYNWIYTGIKESELRLDNVSLSISIDSEDVEINLSTDEIFRKSCESRYDYDRDDGDIIYYINHEELQISNVSLQMKLETVGLMNIVANLGSVLQEDMEAIPELFDSVIESDLRFEFTIGNILIKSAYAESSMDVEGPITLAEFEGLIDSIEYTETIVDISEISLYICYEEKEDRKSVV